MSRQRSWVPRQAPEEAAARPTATRPTATPPTAARPISPAAAAPASAASVPEFAPWARRFAALLVDWIICLVIGVLIGELTGDNIRRSPWLPPVLLFFLYVIFVSAFSWTPGMRLMGVRCVRFPDAGRLAVTQVAVRAALLCLLVPALIVTDGSGRGWHDKAAGSATILAPVTPSPSR